jgi:molybdate transport repressor ModE-like protein
MKIGLELRWRIDEEDVDARMLPLLRAIAKTGSLSQATRDVGLSYRHAWGLLGKLESALGRKLVKLERGRGAHLTPLGEKWLAGAAQMNEQLGPQLRGMSAQLGRELVGTHIGHKERVVLQASHDLALGKLRELLASGRDCDLELHFQGSLDCLAALARGQCDMAGFHVPDTTGRNALLDQYRPWLKSKTLRLVHFATRQQGLIVARSNPLRINALADLVDKKTRFVNRQPGSGTRLFLDYLLATHKIRPAQINGYQLEEFTHAAVAATIASGMADAGFGIEAAARQQGLDFVPLATERYYLAGRSSTLKRPGPRALLAALDSDPFRAILRGLPGYTAPQTLQILDVRVLFS